MAFIFYFIDKKGVSFIISVKLGHKLGHTSSKTILLKSKLKGRNTGIKVLNFLWRKKKPGHQKVGVRDFTKTVKVFATFVLSST